MAMIVDKENGMIEVKFNEFSQMEMKDLEDKVPPGYEINIDKSIVVIAIDPKRKYPKNIRELRGMGGDTENEAFDHRLSVFRALLKFRDAWNEVDGFYPDWDNGDQDKYVIKRRSNTLLVIKTINVAYKTFAFYSEETAKEFIATFHNELITIGELI